MAEQKTSWLSDNIKSIVGLIIVLGVIAYIFMITLISTDTTVRSQALIAMIALGTAVTGYYFGYSQGASKKDDAQAILTANSQTTATTISPAPDSVTKIDPGVQS